MPRRDAALATVELVEADDPVVHEPEGPVRRRRRWWVLVVPVAAVALGLGVQAVHDARLRVADARVAALPGAVDPVGDSIEVLWRSEPGTAALAGGLVVHDTAHGVLVAPNGTVTYDALDLRTGALLWSAPLSGPDPSQGRAKPVLRAECEPDAEPGTEPDRVVCLVTDGAAPFTTPDPRPATRSRIVVLDLADGHALADRPVPPVSSFAVLPGLAATVTVEEGRIVVVATDPLAGTELWRYSHDEPSDQEPSISAAGGMIVLFGTMRGPVVLSATGSLVPSEPGTTSWGTTQDGWFVSEGLSDAGTRVQRVVRPGEQPVEVGGLLLDRAFDDGSVPGLEVTMGGPTRGWDAGTGEQLWESNVSAEPQQEGAALVIEGTVHLTAGDEIVALDARTGVIRWTAARQQGAYGGELLTDGAHVLLVEAPLNGKGTAFLTVLDRRDGAFVRRLALPATVTLPVSAGRHLVGVGLGDVLVGLG